MDASADKEVRVHAERVLFERISCGDEEAFRIIFERYTQELLPFVTKLTDSPETAREVVQDIFLSLWQRRQSLTVVDHPKAWIVRLASNISINYLRKRAADGRLFDRLARGHAFSTETEDELAARETARLVELAVSSLPAAQQAVYRLSREQHLSIGEIAELQGVSPNTVKNQLVSALKAIRAHLDRTIPAVLAAWILS